MAAVLPECQGGKTEMTALPEDALKLPLAILIDGLIGAERQYCDKVANLRTIMLLCVGATILTILPGGLRGNVKRSRTAATFVSGVGFLGARAMLRGSRHVTGLTTAGRNKSGVKMISRWEAYGRPEEHERLTTKLFVHSDVKEFRT